MFWPQIHPWAPAADCREPSTREGRRPRRPCEKHRNKPAPSLFRRIWKLQGHLACRRNLLLYQSLCGKPGPLSRQRPTPNAQRPTTNTQGRDSGELMAQRLIILNFRTLGCSMLGVGRWALRPLRMTFMDRSGSQRVACRELNDPDTHLNSPLPLIVHGRIMCLSL